MIMASIIPTQRHIRASAAYNHCMQARSVAIGIFIGAVLFSALSVAIAWTGPAAAPPDGNVDAPLNVGSADQVKNAGLSLNALAVFGNAILSGTSRYLNFGTSAGSSGYGIRDNAGTMEFKNSGGTWGSFLSSTGVSSITFTDGTTQTTAPAAGGITEVTTTSGSGAGYGFASCPAGYYRVGCSSTASGGAQPSGSNGCQCNGTSYITCFAYCAK